MSLFFQDGMTTLQAAFPSRGCRHWHVTLDTNSDNQTFQEAPDAEGKSWKKTFWHPSRGFLSQNNHKNMPVFSSRSTPTLLGSIVLVCLMVGVPGLWLLNHKSEGIDTNCRNYGLCEWRGNHLQFQVDTNNPPWGLYPCLSLSVGSMPLFGERPLATWWKGNWAQILRLTVSMKTFSHVDKFSPSIRRWGLGVSAGDRGPWHYICKTPLCQPCSGSNSPSNYASGPFLKVFSTVI